MTTLYLIGMIFSLAFLLDIQFSPNRLSVAWAEPYSAITYPDALPFPASSPSLAEPSPIEESPASEIHWPDHPTWDDFKEAHALYNHASRTPPPT
ncbi:hypothetical protein HYDPIDRAFT_32825 [Hydnomerulius pinastri MD-312]|uniref:Unplaced genomic scaffold scaffold_46, whole genome shotgun sequence n=1 Tax=Hydnomerulius pinastri MD-312 TaxID=994086 RepID=A0A0C9VQ51_9AGAM|nr:hypothetical protein HYDPIDRAFT_32825 [Hydnomerulius pinastri MD-312]